MAIPTPITTMGTFLMKKSSGSSYEKFIDINSFGDLGGTPNKIDATSLSHWVAVSVNGIRELDTISFEANYDKETYKTISANQDKETDFSVWLGGTTNTDGTITPTGVYGKFDFVGTYSVKVNGGGTNEIVHCTVDVTCLSAPALNDGE